MTHSPQEAEVLSQITAVHETSTICEVACVIHNPSDGEHRKLSLLWRPERKIFERICKHGVGHPDPDQYPYWRTLDHNRFTVWDGIHGCDGCCGVWSVVDALRQQTDDDG